MLNRCFSIVRSAWNQMLERQHNAYRRRGEPVTGMYVTRAITALEKTNRYAWIRSLPADVIAQKQQDRERVFANFFAGRSQYPRFRKRTAAARVYSGAQSVPTQIVYPLYGMPSCWMNGEALTTDFGSLRWRDRAHPKQARDMVNARRGAAGRHLVIVMVNEKRAAAGAPSNERHLPSEERRLRRARRSRSPRCGCSRPLAPRPHARLTEACGDYMYKLTRHRVDQTQAMATEDFVVQGHSHKRLARSANDAGGEECRRQVGYECPEEDPCTPLAALSAPMVLKLFNHANFPHARTSDVPNILVGVLQCPTADIVCQPLDHLHHSVLRLPYSACSIPVAQAPRREHSATHKADDVVPSAHYP